MNEAALRRLRANTVSMVYQEPGRALNPSILVGRQVAEVFEIAGKSDKEALELSEEMLRKVRISDPAGVMRRYPHQLSGGMLQRTVIAMALASEPSLLILDEPTTALDATVEAEVLELVKALRAEFGTSLLFISHNLGVIARMCDRVGVLYAGELVEEGPALEVLHRRAPSLHRRAAALHPAPGRRQAQARAGHDPRLSARGRARPPAAASSPAAAGSSEDRCRTEAPPLYEIGGGTALALPLPRAGAERCRGPSRRSPSAAKPQVGSAPSR